VVEVVELGVKRLADTQGDVERPRRRARPAGPGVSRVDQVHDSFRSTAGVGEEQRRVEAVNEQTGLGVGAVMAKSRQLEWPASSPSSAVGGMTARRSTSRSDIRDQDTDGDATPDPGTQGTPAHVTQGHSQIAAPDPPQPPHTR
jgi:hypothetical protein